MGGELEIVKPSVQTSRCVSSTMLSRPWSLISDCNAVHRCSWNSKL